MSSHAGSSHLTARSSASSVSFPLSTDLSAASFWITIRCSTPISLTAWLCWKKGGSWSSPGVFGVLSLPALATACCDDVLQLATSCLCRMSSGASRSRAVWQLASLLQGSLPADLGAHVISPYPARTRSVARLDVHSPRLACAVRHTCFAPAFNSRVLIPTRAVCGP